MLLELPSIVQSRIVTSFALETPTAMKLPLPVDKAFPALNLAPVADPLPPKFPDKEIVLALISIAVIV